MTIHWTPICPKCGTVSKSSIGPQVKMIACKYDLCGHIGKKSEFNQSQRPEPMGTALLAISLIELFRQGGER